MEGTWYPKKRPSLGENHQANVNKNINNDRDNTTAKYGTLSSINDDERNTMEGNKFYVDYSKRGTCKCKHCRKKIAKDEIRIGKSVEYKEKHILQYYHINCVFKSFRRARLSTNVINNINEINGLHQITGKEKLQITSLIDNANLRKTYPPPRPICNPKKSIHLETAPKMRNNILKSTNLPTIKVMFTNADQLTSSKMTELTYKIEEEKSLIIAVFEVKPKNARDCTLKDCEIPNYSLHPVNLENNTGRGIAVYSHC